MARTQVTMEGFRDSVLRACNDSIKHIIEVETQKAVQQASENISAQILKLIPKFALSLEEDFSRFERNLHIVIDLKSDEKEVV